MVSSASSCASLFVLVVYLSYFDISAGDVLKPHIILIIADDLGFNDLSFRGSLQIPTPNLDALAFSGIILNNYYASPICTPSRSALFSGIHPIHTGLQHNVIYGATPYGLPLEVKLLPEYLKNLGYVTHLIGKWHLGHHRHIYTPTFRGFDTYFGHWTGHKDYYDNTAQEDGPQAIGYDLRRGMDVSYDGFGNYTTDIFTDEALKIIQRHGDTRAAPLFLTISHTAVHSANPYQYLQVPEKILQKFSYIKDVERRKYAGMVSKLDESCGRILRGLNDYDLLSNSIIIFTSDNGGPAAGFNHNAASNWPLRGVKNTLWEGGIRTVGLIWSPFISFSSSRVYQNLFHIQDWVPTILDAIGGLSLIRNKIDGISHWTKLNSIKNNSSSRLEILHNIDDIYGNLALRIGKWKILKGTTYNGKWDDWYGPSGNNETHFTSTNTKIRELAINSEAGIIIRQVLPQGFDQIFNRTDIMEELRVKCAPIPSPNPCNLTSGEYCLFNIEIDPCERNNVVGMYPLKLKELIERIQFYREGMVPPINQPKDPRGHPKFWNYTWTNWMDFLEPQILSTSTQNL